MKSLISAVFSLVTVLFVAQAQASALGGVRLEKTYAFPIEKYERVEAAINDAAGRSKEDYKKIFIRDIDATDRSFVRCMDESPIQMPDEDGVNYPWGCSLTFVMDLGNGVTANASQMLYLTKTSEYIRGKMAEANPNETSRLDFQSFFDGGDGSEYYCVAAGTTGAKTWDCYLHFIANAR